MSRPASADAVRVSRAGRRSRDAPANNRHGPKALTAGGPPLAASVIHPAPDAAEEGPHRHAGEEMLDVLRGTAELSYADRSPHLRAGDETRAVRQVAVERAP